MSLTVEKTALDGVVVLTPRRFADARGWFVETFNARLFADVADVTFVQDNQSASVHVGTLRGLHFQAPPFAQGKLVRAVKGSILDVAVDIRRSSPTFGRHVAVMLSAENGRQLWVPAGFAHGFVTREPDTEVAYKVTAPYDRASDGGIIWNDPDLGIDWGIAAHEATLSDKDRVLPRLADLPPVFP
jgi:dTDP-4-dehydrorhamnose 3,5-epimerase